jgi:hypothetical protein
MPKYRLYTNRLTVTWPEPDKMRLEFLMTGSGGYPWEVYDLERQGM